MSNQHARAARQRIDRAKVVGVIYTITILVMGILAGRWTAPAFSFDDDEISCRFQRIAGRFDVHPSELKRDNAMMIVTRGDRAFMFRREDLYQCENRAAGDGPVQGDSGQAEEISEHYREVQRQREDPNE